MEALPTSASILDIQNEVPPSVGDNYEHVVDEPNNPMAPSSATAKEVDSRKIYSYTPFTNTHGVKPKDHSTPSPPFKNNEGVGLDLSRVGNMNPDDLIQVAPLDANGNSTGFDGNPEIPFPLTNGETNAATMHNPSTDTQGEEGEQEQSTLVEEEEQAHEWIAEEEDEWEAGEEDGLTMTERARDSEMSNMIVKLGDSNSTAPPTDLDSVETELEDYIDESMKQFEGTTERQDSTTTIDSTDTGDSTEPESPGDDSSEDTNDNDEESSDEDGDEESSDEDEESSNEGVDAEQNTDPVTAGGATTPVGDSPTPVPTDLESIETEMEDFIEESMANWSSAGKGGAVNGTDVKKKQTAGGSIVHNGTDGNKDELESLLDDDATKALFGDPTRAPTTQIMWNDTAPVFKPELPASAGTACSLSDYQACMTDPYVLGGAASIVLILLLCICRKCCCRKAPADNKGQYREVAAQYGDMKYDNTFSDDYSADGSTGDIELSLSEVNG